MKPNRVLHDLLLANLREAGASHVEAECAYCSQDPEEPVTTKTYSEAELAAAVEAAQTAQRATSEARIAELEAAQSRTEVDVAVATALEAPTARIAELENSLAAAELAAATERDARQAVEAARAAEETAAAEAAAATARQGERVARVREVASFAEETWLADNGPRWAAQSDDAFNAELEGFRTIIAKAPKVPARAGTGVPRATAMTAAEQTAPPTTSVLRELRELCMSTPERV